MLMAFPIDASLYKAETCVQKRSFTMIYAPFVMVLKSGVVKEEED